MIAFLREISPCLDHCELTHLSRKAIKIERAKKQHAAYAAVLRELGATVEFFSALPEQPDGVFVEDTAVILPEVVVIARPGAASRLREIESVATTLESYRPVQRIADEGQLDGGDVLRIGRTLYVAQSRRTNAEGVASLREIVEPFGYTVRTVEIHDCLHLKTACTFIPPHFLVVNPAWVNPAELGNLVVIPVDEAEPFAANTFTLAGATLVSASWPKTEKRLREAGITTRRLDISELEKAEAGMTCLNLMLEPRTLQAAATDLGLKVIQAPAAPTPAGHWSQAIVHGGLVYVSPQLPMSGETARGARASVDEQTEQVLTHVAAILVSAGSSLPRVLRATIHLAEPKYLARVEAVYARMFAGHRPTRAVIVNAALPAGVLVTIEVVAAVATE